MRFLSIYKHAERGTAPTQEEMATMGALIEEGMKSGWLIATEGCLPSALGARVRRDGTKLSVVDGPFTEAKEIVAGYWVWECASRDEALEWLKRAPFDGGVEIELRQVFEAEDFGEELTPELRETNARLREQAAQQG